MAGFITDRRTGQEFQFHIGTPDLAERLCAINDYARVISLVLDGDELDAALWGLENYKKGRN